MSGNATPAMTRKDWIAFALILALAAAVRMFAVSIWSIHHPDEIFQYLEPAHKMVFGQGVVTWEYRYGMRSWLIPLALSGVMRTGEALSPGGTLYLDLPRTLIALAGLLVPASAYWIGRRHSPAHGLVAMAVAAIWFETVYFSAHILTEALAVAAFMPAAALMLTASPGQGSVRRFALAGFALGLAVVMRFHYGPALALFAILLCKTEWRARWLPLVIGGLLAMLLSAAADLARDAVPFRWILVNFEMNLVHDRAANYGTAGPLHYFGLIWVYWQWSMPLLLAAMVPAVRKNWPLALVALVNLGIHMLIGHKEYRFILLTTTIVAVLAGIGSVDWVQRLRGGSGAPSFRTAAGLIAGWAALSATLAFTGPISGGWRLFQPELLLASRAGRDPGMCAIGLYRLPLYGGYSYLHRDVPIYLTDWDKVERLSSPQVAAASRAFNRIIMPSDVKYIPPHFRRQACIDGTCLLARPGGCDPAAARGWRVETLMLKHDA